MENIKLCRNLVNTKVNKPNTYYVNKIKVLHCLNDFLSECMSFPTKFEIGVKNLVALSKSFFSHCIDTLMNVHIEIFV